MVMRNLILQMLETNLHLQRCASQHCETDPHWLWTPNRLETTSMRPTEPAQMVHLLMKFLEALVRVLAPKSLLTTNGTSSPENPSLYYVHLTAQALLSTLSAFCLLSTRKHSRDRTV